MSGKFIEGKNEGLKEGRAEGRAEGRTEAEIEIAKNLLSAGIDIKLISKTTGLSEAEIKKRTS